MKEFSTTGDHLILPWYVVESREIALLTEGIVVRGDWLIMKSGKHQW